ncbi:MAG: hypothetical protein AAFR37_11970, partial [Cyanobacteria bacterium J06628_3]
SLHGKALSLQEHLKGCFPPQMLRKQKLYREDSRRWHLTNAWVVDNIDQAEVLAQQYLLICGIE